MTRISKILCAVALAAGAALPVSADENDVSLRPNIHGAIRARYELDTRDGLSRWQVRNARVTLDGRPADFISYFIQADLCDRGSFKPLDFYVRLKAWRGLSVQAGQFRMPFGIETFRAPNNYIFSNRSFIGKQICNYRAVGAKVGYTFDQQPVTLEAGVFNPSTIGDHTGWHRTMAYAAKGLWSPGEFTFAAGFMSIRPDRVRTNLADLSVGWHHDRWLVQAEYMYEHYTRQAYKDAHGYCLFGDYRMPVKLGKFNRLSFQGRFDGMTAHSDAKCDGAGELLTNDPRRNRITVGSTLTYFHSPAVYLDLRIDYEKYFYSSNTVIATGEGDKILAELVLRF